MTTASRLDTFAERRKELAAAAVQTLSELGYARTSLRDREIAQKSEFSHGVLQRVPRRATRSPDRGSVVARRVRRRLRRQPRGIDARGSAPAPALVRPSRTGALRARIVSRLHELAGEPQTLPHALVYALVDGVFQQSSLKHRSGDPDAIELCESNPRTLLERIVSPRCRTARSGA